MKNVMKNIVFLILFLLPVTVLAEGNITVSPSSIIIEKGDTASIKISAYNTIGDVSISSNNPNIAKVNTSEWSTGMIDAGITTTGTITVTGNDIGTTNITFTLDAATFDEDDLAGQTRIVAVTVKEKEIPKPSNESQVATKPENTTKPENQPNQPNINNKSDNNNIKELSVNGRQVTKIDDNNYTLTVLNTIDEINISVVAEDSRATIDGSGNKKLEIGENIFEITVTSESGIKKNINVKIIRKDINKIEDLEELLADNNANNIDIFLDKDTIITNELLDKIKSSKKNISLNYYDEGNNLLYAIIIYGDKIEELNEFDTNIINISSNKIFNSIKNNKGIIINAKNIFPVGTTIKLFVGNIYRNGEILKVYYYDKNSNKLKIHQKNLKVKNGYIEFQPKNNIDFIVTKNINNKNNNLFLIIAFSIIIIIILILSLIFWKKREQIISTLKKKHGNGMLTILFKNKKKYDNDFKNEKTIDNNIENVLEEDNNQLIIDEYEENTENETLDGENTD